MQEYRLDIVDNHLIADIDGKRALIDTGAPASFGKLENISILGRSFNINRTFMGVTVESMEGFIGTKLDFLIGNDILTSFKFLVDMQNGKIFLSDGDRISKGAPVDLIPSIGGPVVEMEVNCHPLKIFIDTGAKLSYIHRDFTEGLEKYRDADDFHPGIGNFSTPVFRVPVNFAGAPVKIDFGNLPPMLQMTLEMSGAKGVVGPDLLRFFNIEFALGEGKIYVEKINK